MLSKVGRLSEGDSYGRTMFGNTPCSDRSEVDGFAGRILLCESRRLDRLPSTGQMLVSTASATYEARHESDLHTARILTRTDIWSRRWCSSGLRQSRLLVYSVRVHISSV